MDDLVEFLRARLDEEERVAQAAGGAWVYGPAVNWVLAAVEEGSSGPAHRVACVLVEGEREHIVRHDPARVLRDTAARRQILGFYTSAVEDRVVLRDRMREVIHSDPDEFAKLHRRESELIEAAQRMSPVVQVLALSYADHPDYREEWRP